MSSEIVRWIYIMSNKNTYVNVSPLHRSPWQQRHLQVAWMMSAWMSGTLHLRAKGNLCTIAILHDLHTAYDSVWRYKVISATYVNGETKVNGKINCRACK